MRGSRFYLVFFFPLACDSFALVTGNNSFSSEAAGNLSVMKDLAFGMATFRDPAAGFHSVLICTFLHLRQSLATTQSCNSFFPFSPVGLRGADLKAWGFRHFTLLLTPDYAQFVTKTFTAVPSSEENCSGFSFRYWPPNVLPKLSLPPLVLLPPGSMLIATSLAFQASIDAECVHQLLPLPGAMVGLVMVGLFASRSPCWHAGEVVVCPCLSCPEVTVLVWVSWERPTMGTNISPLSHVLAVEKVVDTGLSGISALILLLH